MKTTAARQALSGATIVPFGAPAPRAGSHQARPGTHSPDFELHRTALARCALWLLGSGDAAARVVDDVFADAAKELFSERDSAAEAVRAHLFETLEHHAVARLRERTRGEPMRDDSAEDGGDGAPAFLADGHWCEEPGAWGDGPDVLAATSFQAALERCIGLLPRHTACVFTLREVLGLAPRQICATLHIDAATCASMLCRARLAVHQRLQREWFARKTVQ